MAETKRGRGRPKKERVIENPDCEPATKGFVKCLMRKYDGKHTHEQTSGGFALFLLSGMFVAAWLALVTIRPGVIDPVYIWMAGLFAVVTAVAAYELESVGGYRTAPPTGMFERDPKYLQAYEAPKVECEPKKECE
jgi:hypothetical protein